MENTIEMQNDARLTERKKRVTSREYVLGAMMLLSAGLTGILPTSILSVVMIALSVIAALTGVVYFMYPIMLFYGNILGLFAGISVYRWFTLLFLGITIIRHKNFPIQIKQLAVLFLFAIYCLVVVGLEDLRRALFAILDMMSILVLINCYLKDKEILRKFFTIYVACAFVAYFTGMHLGGMQGNLEIGGEYIEISRNMATFEDPNYMGYFYTGAIFALVALKLFHPAIRLIMIVGLYAMLMTSLSVTAVVVNILLWGVYLVVAAKLKPKAILLTGFVVILALGIYQYGIENPTDPVVGALSLRIQEKLQQTAMGNFDDATTHRTGLASAHIEYFLAQPLYKMLIGMNASSTLKIDMQNLKGAAHNEYVDWLLNVGIIGTIIMLGYLLSALWRPLKSYLRNREDRGALCIVLIKLVFAFYAFSLTLYGDHRFMLFMLI